MVEVLAKIPVAGNIVGDCCIGAAHILISDAAYIGKSRKEFQNVLDEAAQASWNILVHRREQGDLKNKSLNFSEQVG